MVLQGDSTYSFFLSLMNNCIEIMKYKFTIFGVQLALWDIFLWSIVMYALLKLFFALFE